MLVELGERNELQVFDAKAAVEPVQLFRTVDVCPAEHAQDVEFDLVLMQQFDAPDDTLPGASAFFVKAVQIVDLFGAVQRNAEQPAVILKKVAPILIQQDRVRLERIAHGLPSAAILHLEFD